MPDLDAVRLRQRLNNERAFYWIIIIALVIVIVIVIPRGSQCAINVDGKTVAWVENMSAARHVEQAVRDEYVAQATHTFGKATAKTLRLKQSIVFSRRHPEGNRSVSEKEAANLLRLAVTPQVKGAVILVAGKSMVALPTHRMAEETLESVKLKKFGGNPDLASRAQIKGGAKIEERYVDLSLMRGSVDQAVAYLLGDQEASKPSTHATSTDSETTYTVQAGDTGMAIARKLHRPLSELQQLNPDIDWKKLKVGDTLKVRREAAGKTQADPSDVSVETTKEITRTESIPFQTDRRRSLKLNPGEHVVSRKGVKGQREVRYRVTYQNGQEIKREKIDERVVKQPVNEEILFGSNG